MSAKRAFHLRSSIGLYGAEHMLLGLCAEQQRRGQQPTLCTFVQAEQGKGKEMKPAATTITLLPR